MYGLVANRTFAGFGQMSVYLLLQWGWGASVLAKKALESHCESILKGRKFFSRSILLTL